MLVDPYAKAIDGTFGCQDNEITWVDWEHADLTEFTGSVSALRAAHPVFRRRRFFDGRPVRRRGSEGVPDFSWFAPDGSEMSDDDWDSGFGKSIAVYHQGDGNARELKSLTSSRRRGARR